MPHVHCLCQLPPHSVKGWVWELPNIPKLVKFEVSGLAGVTRCTSTGEIDVKSTPIGSLEHA